MIQLALFYHIRDSVFDSDLVLIFHDKFTQEVISCISKTMFWKTQQIGEPVSYLALSW